VTPPRLPVAVAAVAAGAVIGSLARAGLTNALPIGSGFPWTVFAINVVGSALLAALPAVAVVRRTPWLGVFLGAGVMGGFTTMSAASSETVTLFEHHHAATAVSYCVGTLIAALIAVWLVDRLTTSDQRADAETTGVDA
jgi:CrcB protein